MSDGRKAKADQRLFDDFVPDNRGIDSCEHPQGALYLDDDETKCRECARIVAVVQPQPKAWTIGPMSCLNCRRPSHPKQISAGALRCSGCRSPLVVLDSAGNHQFPPFDPPSLKKCLCCKFALPPFCFYSFERNGRTQLFSRCRRCLSHQRRLQREADPESHRARSREYSKKMQQERVEGKRPPVRETMTAGQKARQAEATQRSRLRKTHVAIPLLTPGRSALYFKAGCRLAQTCPLGRFCNTTTTTTTTATLPESP